MRRARLLVPLVWLVLVLPVPAQDAREGGRELDEVAGRFFRTVDEWDRAGDGGWCPPRREPGAASLRARFEELREEIAEGMDPAVLDDESWIDYHILEGMIEHRLAHLELVRGDPSYALPPPDEVEEALGDGDPERAVDLYARLAVLPARLATVRAELRPPHRKAVDDAILRIDRVRSALARLGPAADERLGEFGSRPRDVRARACLALAIHRARLAGPVAERAPPKGHGVGRDRFLADLVCYHGIETPLEEIVATAERVLSETERELERTAARIDPTKTWRELTEEAKSAGPPEDVVEFCSKTAREALDFLLAGKFVPVPEFARNLGVAGQDPKRYYPYGFYQPPEGRDLRGTFVVTTVGDWMSEEERRQKLRDSNPFWLRVVTIHEGLPGHHLQFAFAARARTKVRSRYYTPFFSEGWALYCEELLWRHGFYPDDQTRLAQLRMRAWRAARVLADVGIHAGTMTPDEARRLLVERCLLEPVSAEKEVDRYLGSPTQPMSYLVGWLEIERLRENYRRMRRDAPGWELEFHERLLSHGSVPVRLLRAVLLGERARMW